MLLSNFPKAHRPVIQKVAKDNNISVSEALLIYTSVWKTIETYMRNDDIPVKIMLHGMGELRPKKKWKLYAKHMKVGQLTEKERNEFIRDK